MIRDIKNIFVVGGGTAGHVIPAIQLSRELIQNNYKVIFITDYRMFDFVEKNIKDLGYDLDVVIDTLQKNLIQGDLTLPEGLQKESFADD